MFSAALSPPETPKSGNGTLAIIEFHVENVGRCDLHLYDVAIRDEEDIELPYETADGYFNNMLLAKIAVDPPEIIDPTLLPPKTFDVNITIDDVEDLYGYGFNLTFNNDVLICLQASVHDVLGETHYLPEIYISNLKGFVWINVFYYPPATPIATYDPLTFVTIKFRVKSSGVSHLNLTDTSLTDSTGAPLVHEVSNGFVMTLIRDIAVTNVVPSRTWAYAGWPINITVTVKNLGLVSETFDVRVFANITLIDSSTVFNLPAGGTMDVLLTWDTTGYPESYLVIRAEVDIVPFEMNTADNEFTDGTVTILTTIRDVAVTNVVPSSLLPYEDWVVNVSVTVENLGQMSEAFDVKAYYDGNEIGTIPVNLDVSEEATVIFSWNVSTVELYHNYTLSAEASQLPFEYNTTNNLFIDGIVSVRMMGDLNNDQKVDIEDIAIVAYAFGSYPGHPRWNPEADLNFDLFVDIQDIAMVAFNFGRT
jgi:hypothetical protein